MGMLLKISWRNIWRNSRRSLVMISAIAVGLWGGVFVSALSFGLLEQRFKTSIEQHISHIQIHHPEFLKDRNVRYTIHDYDELSKFLSESENISAFSGRSSVNGMFATANLTKGVNIIGIEPGQEAGTTHLDQNIVTGTFFEESIKNPILIGKKLADKTRLQERSKVVLTFQNTEGELVSGAFRVAGIFQTSNSMYDEMNVYVLQDDISPYLGSELVINEVAVVAGNVDLTRSLTDQLRIEFPSLMIRDWAEVSPELSFMQEMTGFMLTIILVIILLALAFGLVNTMLMSVFERIGELGMLMAVGMNKKKIFGMIFWETTFLTFLGAAAGMILGAGSIVFFRNTGIDMSKAGGDSLNEFGFSSVIYPKLEPGFFLTVSILVFITAILTSVYPTLKAIRLKPAEAVRKE